MKAKAHLEDGSFRSELVEMLRHYGSTVERILVFGNGAD